MIRLVGVEKRFGAQPVLAGVDLTVARAGVTFVVGRSGAGKSVLSRCSVGLLRVDAGEVWVDGERVEAWPWRRLMALRRRVSYVVQGPALLDTLTLVENVALPLVRTLALGRTEAVARARRALESVGLGDSASKRPHEVGPGDSKRAAIARALALEPTAVIYDEPTTGLDAEAARKVDTVIRAAAGSGVTALVVSHDVASLKAIADRVALLERGRIAFEGTSAELVAARGGHLAVRRFFGDEAGE